MCCPLKVPGRALHTSLKHAEGFSPFVDRFLTLPPALLQDLRDQARPARLVAGPQARAGVAVEILVERTRSRQCGSSAKIVRAAVGRATARLVRQEQAGQAGGQFGGHLPQVIQTPMPVGHSTL